MVNKTCSKCSESKPEDEFPIGTKGKRRAWCKVCQYKAQREWYKKNQPRQAANVARWKKENPVSAHNSRLKKYGITRVEWDIMVKSQNGLCAICGRTRGLAVDHCHSSGVVRGLLCGPCNRGIGFFEDNVSLLLSAVQYLSRNLRKAG